MTKQDKEELKNLIKEGTLEVFQSREGQDAIVNALGSPKGQGVIVSAMSSQEGQDAIVNALGSPKGQGAIVSAMSSEKGQAAIVGAMGSPKGQQAIKQGTLAALKSEEGQVILIDNFAEGFHKVIVPVLQTERDRISRLERKMGVITQ